MSIKDILNMPINSNFSLTFLVDMGSSKWYYGEEDITNANLGQNFRSKIPRNELFQINAMIFNVTKHQREIIAQYNCYLDENSNGLLLILNDSASFSEFTKEIMMDLFKFCEKVGIKTYEILISKKHPQYVQLLEELLIVGFKSNEIKNNSIGESEYIFMKM